MALHTIAVESPGACGGSLRLECVEDHWPPPPCHHLENAEPSKLGQAQLELSNSLCPCDVLCRIAKLSLHQASQASTRRRKSR